jgi:hypothetical protein
MKATDAVEVRYRSNEIMNRINNFFFNFATVRTVALEYQLYLKNHQNTTHHQSC